MARQTLPVQAIVLRPLPEAPVPSRLGWLRPPHLRKAWRLGHFSAVGVLLILFLGIVTEDVYPTSIQLSVSATVLKKVWARTLQSPTSLVVTQPDLARGWIDVPQPTVLSVRNNSEDGFVLELQANPALVSRVIVSGLPLGQAQFGASGGVVSQRGWYRQETRLELRWRVYLPQDAQPGQYQWPIVLHVDAI